jgi:flagellar biosynthesis protein FliR
LRVVFGAFVHAGQIIAMQMGLGFASMVDPLNGVQVPVVSQFYVVLVTLMFLALDGHLALIEVLADSFRVMPIAPTGLALSGIWDLLGWASRMFAGALQIALPAVASLLLVNIAFGVMTRAAPQLNIFAIGFPISMILGFVVLLITLPGMSAQLGTLLNDAFALIHHLMGTRVN